MATLNTLALRGSKTKREARLIENWLKTKQDLGVLAKKNINRPGRPGHGKNQRQLRKTARQIGYW